MIKELSNAVYVKKDMLMIQSLTLVLLVNVIKIVHIAMLIHHQDNLILPVNIAIHIMYLIRVQTDA